MHKKSDLLAKNNASRQFRISMVVKAWTPNGKELTLPFPGLKDMPIQHSPPHKPSMQCGYPFHERTILACVSAFSDRSRTRKASIF